MKGRMNGISLFSGYGGIDLALSEYVRTMLYCEIERYPQGILLSRMDEGSIDFAPVWNDVTTINGKDFKGLVDIVFGGFPCQDISVAGKGAGLEGKRSGLFYEIIRICKEASPQFIFLENVPAIRTRGSIEVTEALASIGYDCRWTTLSASEVGANHKRERWFLLAHPHNSGFGKQIQQISELYGKESSDTWSNGEVCSLANANVYGQPTPENTRADRKKSYEGREEEQNKTFKPEGCRTLRGDKLARSECLGTQKRNEGFGDESKGVGYDSLCEGLEGQWKPKRIQEEQSGPDGHSIKGDISNTNQTRLQAKGAEFNTAGTKQHRTLHSKWWSIEPNVGRVANGVTSRVDRIKALGNGVVPLQVKTAFEILMGIK